MKLPNKAYEAEFISSSEIGYLPRKDSSARSLTSIRLPKWLSELISSVVSEAKENGKEEAREKIREALGIDQ